MYCTVLGGIARFTESLVAIHYQTKYIIVISLSVDSGRIRVQYFEARDKANEPAEDPVSTFVMKTMA